MSGGILRRLAVRFGPSWLEEELLLGRIDNAVWGSSRSRIKVVTEVEELAKHKTLTPEVRRALASLLRRSLHIEDAAEATALYDRIDDVLHPTDVAGLRPVDAWTTALLGALRELDPGARTALLTLFDHCGKAKGGKPTKGWSKQAEALLAALQSTLGGRMDPVLQIYTDCLSAVGTKALFDVVGEKGWVGEPRLVSYRYTDHLRGWIWLAEIQPSLAASSLLGDVACRAYQKVPGYGPLAARNGNACVYVLTQRGSADAVGQLGRLKATIKNGSILRNLDRSMEKLADGLGLSTVDLEEIAVPACGLDSVGLAESSVGDFIARLVVEGTKTVRLLWRKADGKEQKSVPSQVKSNHGDELLRLRKQVKEIKKLLPSQRARLERMMMAPRELPYEAWKERYLDHPLVGTIARRLIWRFAEPIGGKSVDAIWHQDALTRLNGESYVPPKDTTVSMWHPIEVPVDQVQTWRAWLEDRGVTQPFKQAHREIYVLTDAERETRFYSSRFANHILKQHQFAALSKERGWQFSLMGGWDSHNIPDLVIAEHGLRVTYDVDWAAEHETSDAGIYLYVSTGRVGVVEADSYEPVALADVPPHVFSELMRDVDLFVSVCSVANDPTWANECMPTFDGYWADAAFGKLGEIAKTRRELLERIVPKLKIAKQCSLDDRFLVVDGKLRRYYIHLGSANVRMSPNDQHLCIVPGRSRGARVSLPFEGGSTLTLILSKALLLASDDQIKDKVILEQIRKGLPEE
jgi:hypothetical protein